MLFDVTPEEPEKTKKKARRATPEVARQQEAVPPPVRLAAAPTLLGKIDDVYECADERCGGTAFDIVDEFRGEWVVQCCFCNTSIRGTAIKGYLKPRGEDFVFNDGRFAGMSVADAWGQPRGRDYVEWAAAEHPRQAVRDACKKHLDSISAAT